VNNFPKLIIYSPGGLKAIRWKSKPCSSI